MIIERKILLAKQHVFHICCAIISIITSISAVDPIVQQALELWQNRETMDGAIESQFFDGYGIVYYAESYQFHTINEAQVFLKNLDGVYYRYPKIHKVDSVELFETTPSHSSSILASRFDTALSCRLVCWCPTNNQRNKLPSEHINRRFKAVAVGPFFTVALTVDGTVITWGDIDLYKAATVPSGLVNIVAIAAGDRHVVALKSDGTIVAWGNNSYGQCDIPSGLGSVVAVSAGANHTVVLRNDGTVVAWGLNSGGQCDIPVSLKDVKAVSAGALHTVALKAEGTVVAWGWNGYGECTIPASLQNVNSISAGRYQTAALNKDGVLVIWGKDSYSRKNHTGAMNFRQISQVTIGYDFNMALDRKGHVIAIGGKPKWLRRERGTYTYTASGKGYIVALRSD